MMLAHHQPKICGDLLCSIRFRSPARAFWSRLRVSMDPGEVNASRTERANDGMRRLREFLSFGDCGCGGVVDTVDVQLASPHWWP